MKKILLLLAVSFVIVRCTPDHDHSKNVTVNFAAEIDDAATVTFTGEQSQGVYTFAAADGDIVTKALPNVGTYQICIVNNVGCPTYFQDENGNTLYNVHPCGTGRTLANEYFMFTQCE